MSDAILNIRANARELSTAARVMQRFGVTGMRASRTIKREMKDLGNEIKTLTGEQRNLTAELLKAEKGSEAYKKLATQLKGVKGALKEARTELKEFGDIRGGGARDGGMRRAGGAARALGLQTISAVGAAGPEQTYATMGQIAGGVGTAMSNVPLVGAGLGVLGVLAQAGFNVMQRRSSMLLSAHRARQAAGAYVMPGWSGIGDKNVTATARAAAKQGFGVEEAYGIMRSFGQAGGYRAGIGTLELSRMGFGPGAMMGAQLYAPGFGGGAYGSATSFRRGEAGKDLLRQVTAQTRLESRLLFGTGAERSITPSTVEERLTEMVGYLKQMAMEGVEINPEAFQRQTLSIFGLGGQAGKPGLFAGGRAFRFQTAMREGQRQEGGMLNFMAMMASMRGGKDIISAMEESRLGRVPMEQLQTTARGLGLGKQRWMQFQLGKQIGKPMEEVAAWATGDLGLVPKGIEEMGKGGALRMFREAAPVSKAQKELLRIKAKEMGVAEGSLEKMVQVADKMIDVQTGMAEVAKETHNALVEMIIGLKVMKDAAQSIADFFAGKGLKPPDMTESDKLRKLKF